MVDRDGGAGNPGQSDAQHLYEKREGGGGEGNKRGRGEREGDKMRKQWTDDTNSHDVANSDL